MLTKYFKILLLASCGFLSHSAFAACAGGLQVAGCGYLAGSQVAGELGDNGNLASPHSANIRLPQCASKSLGCAEILASLPGSGGKTNKDPKNGDKDNKDPKGGGKMHKG